MLILDSSSCGDMPQPSIKSSILSTFGVFGKLFDNCDGDGDAHETLLSFINGDCDGV
jgi:hypothetical protein